MVSLIACVLVSEADRERRTDADGDGVISRAVGGEDCDDADPAVGARTERYVDADGDAFGAGEAALACEGAAEGGDCDDADALVNPGAVELACDDAGLDEDCDGDVRCGLEDLSPSIRGPGVGMSMARLDDDDGMPQIAVGGVDRFGIVAITGAGVHDLSAAASSAEGGVGVGFGEALLAFDFDEDGVRDLAVASPRNKTGEGYGPENGLIELFRGPHARGTLTPETFVFGIHGEGRLGAVMAAGTANEGDQDTMLVLGVPAFDGECGAVEVIRRPFSCVYGTCDVDENTAWGAHGASFETDCYLRGGADQLGASVAVGDVGGEGFDDVLMGAPGGDTNRPDAGMVYLWYDGAYDVVDIDREFAGKRIVGENDGDAAGGAVALVDVSGDGASDLVVGAAGSDLEAAGGGAVYVWDGPTALNWAFDSMGEAHLSDGVATLTHTTADARLGTTVAAAGDVDGDGRQDVAIAAPGAGEVWIVLDVGTGLRAVGAGDRSWTCAEPACDAGAAMLGAGDLTGDAVDDLLVGLPGAETIVVLQGEP